MIAVGATMPSINTSILSTVDILLPTLPEQYAIAGVLSSLDDKIDLLHRQNKTLEGMAKALWRKMFVEEADPGWEKGKLGDLVELCYGKGLKEEKRIPGRYPVYGSNAVVGYHNDFLVEGPGIVIGRKGTLGVVNYVEENFFPIDTTFYIKSKTNAGKLFFEYFLLKEFDFEDMNSDSAVPGLNREIAESIELVIPMQQSIMDFNEFCDPLCTKKLKNDHQIRTLSHLRDTLLPKLMSGEVRVAL
jgi:type I restriction enzyme, S subunit